MHVSQLIKSFFSGLFKTIKYGATGIAGFFVGLFQPKNAQTSEQDPQNIHDENNEQFNKNNDGNEQFFVSTYMDEHNMKCRRARGDDYIVSGTDKLGIKFSKVLSKEELAQYKNEEDFLTGLESAEDCVYAKGFLERAGWQIPKSVSMDNEFITMKFRDGSQTYAPVKVPASIFDEVRKSSINKIIKDSIILRNKAYLKEQGIDLEEIEFGGNKQKCYAVIQGQDVSYGDYKRSAAVYCVPEDKFTDISQSDFIRDIKESEKLFDVESELSKSEYTRGLKIKMIDNNLYYLREAVPGIGGEYSHSMDIRFSGKYVTKEEFESKMKEIKEFFQRDTEEEEENNSEKEEKDGSIEVDPQNIDYEGFEDFEL